MHMLAIMRGGDAPLVLSLSTVRGAAGKVKHLTEMLVDILRGDASSLACTAYLQTQLWDVPVLDRSLLLYAQ